MSRYFMLGLLPLVLAMTACSDGAPEQTQPVRPALVTQPLPASAMKEVYPGEVRARYEPELGFRIAGKISQRKVNVGDRVDKGQVLATLDTDDVGLQLDASRARFASAKADHRLARNEKERYQELLERQVVSRSQYDNVESRFEASQAQLKQARANLRVARNQTDYANLKAPEKGVVAQRLAEAGQVVAAGQPVFVLAVDGDREVRIDLPEQDVDRFSVGMSVALELWSRPGEHFPGKIRELAPAADRRSRTFEAHVAFDNDEVGAELGQSARVFVNGIGKEKALTIPLSALTAEQEQRFVWVVKPQDSTLVKTPVTVGAYREDSVPVLDGLKPDDWVVAAGTQLLRDGQTVQPVDRKNRQVQLDTDNSDQ